MSRTELTTVVVAREQDVVRARHRARQVARLLRFDDQDQVRVATAVSELARNALEYGGGGKVQYFLDDATDVALTIEVCDDGPGIENVDAVLGGRYSSPSGMGAGIVGARRLMDSFELETEPGRGTVVAVSKRLPTGWAPTASELQQIDATLGHDDEAVPAGELKEQSRELIQALAELQTRKEEIADLNRELAETNRGVVALYAELDERAEDLRQTSETKSRFLSSLSHELRTPLTSMLALCELLLNRVDGPLTDEQEHQVRFIHTGADSLLGLVNDLLDLARVEAGKTQVRPTEFEIDAFLGLLRGMFRPLHDNPEVALVFESATDLPTLYTDEAKLAQIIRNLVSNALKFTPAGEVRVSCALDEFGSGVFFSVRDTGIGISPEDRLAIFDEFVQVESALQANLRGSGLGLAVSQRLATVLGARIDVASEVGTGSTFTVQVPLVYRPLEVIETDEELEPAEPGRPAARVALVIDDDEVARYLARKTLVSLGYLVQEASEGAAGITLARELRPELIVLDLMMPDLDGFIVLQELKMDFRTTDIPIIVQTAKKVTGAEQRMLEPAAAIIDKRDAGRGSLVTAVESLTSGDQ